MTKHKRHELEVTADRLGDHYQKYYPDLDADALKAIRVLRDAFDDLANVKRGGEKPEK